MRTVTWDEKKPRVATIAGAFAAAVLVIGAVVCLTLFIDQKLNQSAEQQVVTFTEQAADSVADRMAMVQDAIGAFTVQSADPAEVRAALAALEDRMGFAGVAFAGVDGTGCRSDGSPFSIDDLAQPETALSQGASSFSPTFANEEGKRVRLAQQPLSIDGQQVGALYVQVPLDLFTMPAHLDMFGGRGYFILFESKTGEILVPPVDAPLTPIADEASIYDFLNQSSRYAASSSFDLFQKTSDVWLAGQLQRGDHLAALRGMVDKGESGLTTAMVDGKASYISVAPVYKGHWYACGVIPMENVRAEVAVVTTTFQVVFGIVLACLLLAGLLSFAAYRRRLRERNVAMLAQLYQALSESLELAVNLYSPSDGKITPIVAKTKRIVGYPLVDFLKNERVASEVHLSSEGTALCDRVKKGLVLNLESGEFSFLNPQTGCERWVAYSVRPLTFEGKPQVLIVLRDATPEKQIQLSMKDAMDAAESANQAKSEFLSRMSHEIRTPMNVIIGMLQIAQGNADDCEKVKASLVKLGLASDHLLGLINDVLDLSKIESGKMTLTSGPFLLEEVIEDAVSVVRAQIEQRDQDFALTMPCEGGELLVGDAARMKQLVVNLLANSVKYTPEGGCVRLEVKAAPMAVMGYRRITLIVSDNGIGMAPDFIGRVFEPFAMEGRSREQGTGLGMSIVKNIVTMMGGVINVRSAVGEGTTFEVLLSMRIALETEREAFEKGSQGLPSLEDEAAAVSSSGNGSKPLPASLANRASNDSRALEREDLEGLRVLVVEDNELNAEIACELLSDSGLLVERASDGVEACSAFEESPLGYFDAILMDVQMPNMNGYDATRCIRALDRADASSVPIIAMSANAFSDDVSASLESGMNAHLSKPIEMRRVLATIVRFVRADRG